MMILIRRQNDIYENLNAFCFHKFGTCRKLFTIIVQYSLAPLLVQHLPKSILFNGLEQDWWNQR